MSEYYLSGILLPYHFISVFSFCLTQPMYLDLIWGKSTTFGPRPLTHAQLEYVASILSLHNEFPLIWSQRMHQSPFLTRISP
jgi:hypothetical protein